jgi:hypothetical protein
VNGARIEGAPRAVFLLPLCTEAGQGRGVTGSAPWVQNLLAVIFAIPYHQPRTGSQRTWSEWRTDHAGGNVMSSEPMEPELDIRIKPTTSTRLSGRAWVKRDMELWHRCTIERYTGAGVQVAMDNMDVLIVSPDCVAQFDLEPGTLVFWQHWDNSLSGYPAYVVSVQGEAVEIDLPDCFHGRAAHRDGCLLRDLRVYCDFEPLEWKVGFRVFAYKAGVTNFSGGAEENWVKKSR